MVAAAVSPAERMDRRKEEERRTEESGKGEAAGECEGSGHKLKDPHQTPGKQEAPEREGNAWQSSRTAGGAPTRAECQKSTVWGTAVPVTRACSGSVYNVAGWRCRARTLRVHGTQRRYEGWEGSGQPAPQREGTKCRRKWRWTAGARGTKGQSPLLRGLPEPQA